VSAAYTYEYPRPALTVDVVALRHPEGAMHPEVLLVRRGQEPFLGKWALPGGFVDEGERLEHAARRELAEETGLSTRAPMRQFGTFGDPGRDPRGWNVSVAFLLDLPTEEAAFVVRGGDDAEEASWHPLGALPPLAFDHDRIIAVALGDDTP
jgi:8-oxo-dGTP diphosphatase